ncbi:MAG: hypothetical protein NC115_01480 [Bacteroidales bacterium]|nr:hypothetical protein [Bacteroidales bacterium]
MQSRKRIENNPYRILGIYVGSPLSIEVNHLNRIRAFAKVGQEAFFNLKEEDALRPIKRTAELAETAAHALSLPKDRVENSLLWFADESSEWGQVLNRALQALIKGDYTTSIDSYEHLVSDDSLREAFLEAATHGLLAMEQEELACIVSEILVKDEGNLLKYWASPSSKPTGLVTKMLFEATAIKVIEGLMKAIRHNQDDEIDFYVSINDFRKRLKKLIPLCQSCRDIYGHDSIHYKIMAEDVAKSVLAHGSYLVSEIGKFIWIQSRKHDDGSYKKRKSEMPVPCIRTCMLLIGKVDNIVNETLLWLRLDAVSKRALYAESYRYNDIKRNEYVKDDDIIRRSVHSLYIQKGIAITAWLAFLLLLLIAYNI